MSNGSRHALGAVVGAVGIAMVYVPLALGAEQTRETATITAATFRPPQAVDLLPASGLLILAAILIGVLSASRLSPLASLIPGLVFFGFGIVTTFTPFIGREIVTRLPWGDGLSILESTGIVTVIGAILLTASTMPSRWRGSKKAARPETLDHTTSTAH